MTGRVEVRLAALRRAWRAADEGEFWLQIGTDDDAEAQLVGVLAAIDAGYEFAAAGPPTRAPRGWVFEVGFADADHLDRWCRQLGERLEHLGLTATIAPAPEVSYPDWLDPMSTELTAFFAWPVTDDVLADRTLLSTWSAPPETTRAICATHATWTAAGGPQIIVRRGTYLHAVSDATGVPDMLAAALRTETMAAVLHLDPTARAGRHADLEAGNFSLLQQLRDPRPWHQRVDDHRAAVTALPHLTTLAFLRPSTTLTPGWSDLHARQPLPGELRGSHVTHHQHLLTDHTPDAHGIQLLTDAHLAHARDLTNWTITPLGHRRHLVEAPDLTPWYADTLPDPDTLTRARHDFGDMLLRPELFADHPPLWKTSGWVPRSSD